MKFTILGCGSSMGVPRPDGFFGKCDPKNPKNLRTRCSAFIKSRDSNLLIDTSPDLRNQMLKNKIAHIDCVFYTHNHADQTHGINDLRIFCLKNKKKISNPDKLHLHILIKQSISKKFANKITKFQLNSLTGLFINFLLLPNFVLSIKWYNNSVNLMILIIIQILIYIFLYFKLLKYKKIRL